MPKITELEPGDKLLHYVSYTRAKDSCYETTELQTRTHDYKEVTFPSDCTSFELYDKVLHEHQDTTLYLGEIINREQYYIGKLFSLDKLVILFGAKSDIVRECMEAGTKMAVKVAGNEYIPVTPGAHVLSKEQVKTSGASYTKRSYLERY